jgi:hypothetical protein
MAIPGAAIVLAGSCLVSITSMRPAHPKWIELFGGPGAGSEPQIHRGLRLAGWLCILAPFPIYLLFCMI